MLYGNMHSAEGYAEEMFSCRTCGREFEARVATWVDVSSTPQVKRQLIRREFNVIRCPTCGIRSFADTPFFYEDFEEGLLVAVFPRIPDDRGEVEMHIREHYGYYPVLEYFYDMAQLWMLLYLQERYQTNRNLRSLSRLGSGEERIRKFLHFLKEAPMMIEIRERLTESFLGDAAEDSLADLLASAIYSIEGMLPWPRDQRCVCGGDLTKEFKCCGRNVELQDQERLLSRQYIVYCPYCGESLAGASCEACQRVYTWKLGTVSSHAKVKRPAGRRIRARGEEDTGAKHGRTSR